MKFSIITICYNSEKTIERTIKSVLGQTYKDLEYIIVDGCSKDRTLDIVKKYEPLFEGRMKWKSEPDRGIYDAMNKGIRIAKGNIIGIVNSDDWFQPDTLQRVYDYYSLNGHDETSCYCGSINFHYNNGTVQEMSVDLELFDHYSKTYQIGGVRHPAVFVPQKVYKSCGLFDEELSIIADTDLLLRFKNNKVKFIPIPFVLSNMSDGGVSNRYNSKTIEDYKYLLKKNKVSGFKYSFLVTSLIVKSLIKGFIPSSLIEYLRLYHKS